MAEMCDSEEPEEKTFRGPLFVERDFGLLRRLRRSPGCLTWPLLLLLLFISLGFFMLLVTTLVQVSRIHQSLQRETETSRRPTAQEKMQSSLEKFLQQVTWMNATLAGLCHPCPWHWEFFQGRCYLFSYTQSDWKSSVSACQDIGAQLVIINSSTEQSFLQSWYMRHNKATWIGLSDNNNEGSWQWVDNSPLQLSFWQKGEPNNQGDEDCAELHNHGWNDNRCTAENVWICEKPSSPCPAL
uniref:C-type lectin domain-containing protein n=1 Tax=Catagonus wagneri TaxID=51154 RepID=A0A8C3WUH0_9CETA